MGRSGSARIRRKCKLSSSPKHTCLRSTLLDGVFETILPFFRHQAPLHLYRPDPHIFSLLCVCVCVCVGSVSFRYVSWNQGDYSLHMVTEYTRSDLPNLVLTDSGFSIGQLQAGEPFGLAVSPDGAQLYVLSGIQESINWYAFRSFVLLCAAHTMD